MAWLTKFCELRRTTKLRFFEYYLFLQFFFPETHDILTTFLKHKYAARALKNDCLSYLFDSIKLIVKVQIASLLNLYDY